MSVVQTGYVSHVVLASEKALHVRAWIKECKMEYPTEKFRRVAGGLGCYLPLAAHLSPCCFIGNMYAYASDESGNNTGNILQEMILC